jgi:hypothetical protein
VDVLEMTVPDVVVMKTVAEYVPDGSPNSAAPIVTELPEAAVAEPR